MLFIPIDTTRRAVRERQAESAGSPSGFESPDVVTHSNRDARRRSARKPEWCCITTESRREIAAHRAERRNSFGTDSPRV